MESFAVVVQAERKDVRAEESVEDEQVESGLARVIERCQAVRNVQVQPM